MRRAGQRWELVAATSSCCTYRLSALSIHHHHHRHQLQQQHVLDGGQLGINHGSCPFDDIKYKQLAHLSML